MTSSTLVLPWRFDPQEKFHADLQELLAFLYGQGNGPQLYWAVVVLDADQKSPPEVKGQDTLSFKTGTPFFMHAALLNSTAFFISVAKRKFGLWVKFGIPFLPLDLSNLLPAWPFSQASIDICSITKKNLLLIPDCRCMIMDLWLPGFAA